MSGPPNPFDFSDFGSSVSNPDSASPAGFGGGSSGGSPLDQRPSFDVFGDSNGGDAFGPPAPGGDGLGQSLDQQQAHGLFAPEEIAGPPVLWAGIAGAAALIGLALAIVGTSGIGIAATGWMVAGPVAIGLLAVYTALDTKQQTKPFYSQPGWTIYCYWLVLAVALTGVIVGALRIAYWAGTQ